MKIKILSVITASILVFSSVAVNATIPDDDNIYVTREIYNLDFTGANITETVTKATTDEEKAVVMTWQPAKLDGSNVFTDFGGVNSAHTYGVVKDDAVKADEILKLTASAASSNSYVDIKSDAANSDYYIKDKGLLSFSFDFYANGTKVLLRAARTVGEAEDGTRYTVKDEGQRLIEISSDAKLNVFGATYGETLQLPMYSDQENKVYGHDNKWHKIELLMNSKNKYQIYFDDEPLNNGQWFWFRTKGAADGNINCTFGDEETGFKNLSFRGFTTIRLYNCHGAASATQYYDNFNYTVYDNITDDYELPKVSIKNASNMINIEEDGEFDFEFETYSVCPDKIRVYVDNELMGEYNGKECRYTYAPKATGRHIISAEAVDLQGAVSEKCSVTVMVSPKSVITGAFNGGEVSGTYSESDTRTVLFETECVNGFAKAEFYINHVKCAESTETVTEIDFSDSGSGNILIEAVVYDSLGKTKSFSYTATVSLGRSTLLWSENYSSYMDAGNSSIGSMINLTAKNGYHAPVNVDSEHGTSLALGIEQDNGSDTGAYVNFSNPMGTAHIAFETEFYISDYPGEAETQRKEIHFDMVESGSVQNAMFKINSSEIYKGSVAMPYERGKWYNLKIDFDIPNKLYSIYIDGEVFVKNIDLFAEKSDFTSLNTIRCYGPGVATIPCFIAFDNTSITNYENYGIESVSNANDSTQITVNDKTLKLKLSQGILQKSLDVKKIIVAGDEGTINIKSVEYDEKNITVILTLSDSLIGGKNYNVSISGDVLSESGIALGNAISTSFSVIDNSMINIDYSQYSDDGLLLYIASETKKNAYIVVTAWNGKRYLDMKIKKVDFISGMNDVFVPLDFEDSNISLNIYILDSLYNGNMLIRDIYRLNI